MRRRRRGGGSTHLATERGAEALRVHGERRGAKGRREQRESLRGTPDGSGGGGGAGGGGLALGEEATEVARVARACSACILVGCSSPPCSFPAKKVSAGEAKWRDERSVRSSACVCASS